MAGSFLFGRTIIFIGLRRANALPESFLCHVGSGRVEIKTQVLIHMWQRLGRLKCSELENCGQNGQENVRNGTENARAGSGICRICAGAKR